jgi:ABC-2 type transport system permease protein
MNSFLSAFWVETLKARRSKVSPLTAAGFSIVPIVCGLFMIILKDPEAARTMGLISTKSQLVAGTADWSTYFDVMLQATAMGGTMVFAFITSWVFGREFSDRTVKEILSLPTPRWVIVAAKFVLTALWIMGLTLVIFVIGLGIGTAISIPGWSPEVVWSSFYSIMLIALLNLMLMPFVALFASAGRGYLPALGWAVFSFVLAQIVSLLGWGGWIPWSVPVLLSGMFGPSGIEQIGMHSYLLTSLAFLLGTLTTFTWWLRADQAK